MQGNTNHVEALFKDDFVSLLLVRTSDILKPFSASITTKIKQNLVEDIFMNNRGYIGRNLFTENVKSGE